MARKWTSSSSLANIWVIPAATAYVGPGDVVSGARGWWGLRAYTSSSIGSNAVRLRRDSDNAEQDFATIAGGGLDLTAISAFKGAANLFVVKLYDQTGNGNDATQATAANQPAFTLSAIGSLPGATYNNTGSGAWLYCSPVSSNAPVTLSTVAKPSGSTDQRCLFGSVSGALEVRIDNTTNAITMLKSFVASIGTSSGSVSVATWAAILASYDNTNYAFFINGASSGAGVNAVGIADDNSGTDDAKRKIGIVATSFVPTADEAFDGLINETGIWGSILDATQAASLSTNQHAYWGF